jgi:hypothetical protein
MTETLREVGRFVFGEPKLCDVGLEHRRAILLELKPGVLWGCPHFLVF